MPKHNLEELFRDSSMDLAHGLEVREMADTMPADLFDFADFIAEHEKKKRDSLSSEQTDEK